MYVQYWRNTSCIRIDVDFIHSTLTAITFDLFHPYDCPGCPVKTVDSIITYLAGEPVQVYLLTSWHCPVTYGPGGVRLVNWGILIAPDLNFMEWPLWRQCLTFLVEAQTRCHLIYVPTIFQLVASWARWYIPVTNLIYRVLGPFIIYSIPTAILGNEGGGIRTQ